MWLLIVKVVLKRTTPQAWQNAAQMDGGAFFPLSLSLALFLLYILSPSGALYELAINCITNSFFVCREVWHLETNSSILPLNWQNQFQWRCGIFSLLCVWNLKVCARHVNIRLLKSNYFFSRWMLNSLQFTHFWM